MLGFLAFFDIKKQAYWYVQVPTDPCADPLHMQ